MITWYLLLQPTSFICVHFQSPNKLTIPQEKIRPLTSLDHPQSPFYDPEGGAITPVARVVVERIARKVWTIISVTKRELYDDVIFHQRFHFCVSIIFKYSEKGVWNQSIKSMVFFWCIMYTSCIFHSHQGPDFTQSPIGSLCRTL